MDELGAGIKLARAGIPRLAQVRKRIGLIAGAVIFFIAVFISTGLFGR